jgi:sulfur carrier protein
LSKELIGVLEFILYAEKLPLEPAPVSTGEGNKYHTISMFLCVPSNTICIIMITVNGTSHAHISEKTIVEMLSILNINAEKGVAIAVNNVVVAKSSWREKIVSDGDTVLLIKATQGG